MEKSQNQDQRQLQQRINYQDKNLEYLEKIREKKQRQEQDKLNQQRKQQQRRQKLKRKILQQASRNRENRQLQENKNQITEELTPKNLTGMSKKSTANRTKNFDSLPKYGHHQRRIHSISKDIEDGKQTNYKQRHMSFLKNLNQTVKSKKQIEQEQKKKKQIRYAKMKQDLGFNNIESKLAGMISKPKSQAMGRSYSAQKTDIPLQIVDEMPKTNKDFKRKNEQYLEKIKKKRQIQMLQKQEQKQKKQKLKQKLKDYVMVTVKQNVLDGVYDEQQRKNTKKHKNQDQSNQSQEQDEDTPTIKKKSRKLRSFPYITDLTQWKKKNRLEPQDKVFIVTGGYGDIKKALRQRGWYQNPDSSSPCFDLKYTLQSRQIQYDKLLDFQSANHFQKAGCITTKVGLTKSLRNLIWIKDISEDNFYPKCFDLADQDDALKFQTHFKICKALSILKIYDNFVRQSQKSPELKKKNKGLIEDLKLRTEVALNVCKKNVEDIDDIIDKKKAPKIVTDKEWQILAQDELNEESLAKKKHQEWLKSIDCKFNVQSKKYQKSDKKQNKKKIEKAQKSQNQQNQQVNEEEDNDEEQNILAEEVTSILNQYQQKFPQFHITGHNNIWILKPAGLSRGRGITCYNNLVEIQDHIKCKQSQWIAQKYIQNPLVVLKRKFDIRQWVLITDFNPLTIWLYEECYVRFSAVDYDAKQIKNKFIHLTNNSIGAHHKKFDNSHIKGNMFFQDQFSDYIQDLQGYDVFSEKVKPQIKEIVKHSMMCGMQHIENRKNSHQIYGYDFMIDQNYKVWLIQINSSPAMDYSTHVTSRLVKQCLTDIVKVIVDYPSAPKKQRKNVETGKFKKIYKGIQIPQKPITTGLNLCLQGIPMKKPKRNTVKVTNFSLDKK